MKRIALFSGKSRDSRKGDIVYIFKLETYYSPSARIRKPLSMLGMLKYRLMHEEVLRGNRYNKKTITLV